MTRSFSSRIGRGAGGAALLLLAGCAGATVGSGVGDRVLDRPPYVAGNRTVADAACVGHLPVAYQPGASQPVIFDPAGGAGTAVAALLADLTAALDAHGATVRLTPAGPAAGTPPDVAFGCEQDAAGDCVRDETHNVRRPRLHLAVGRPSAAWVAWLGPTLDGAGASAALVLTLEIGQYWTRQRNLLGAKEVELGTNHAVPVPWLTSLDTPVSVVQLTGALIDREGKALRIAAEGLLARRTPLVASGFGLQALITDEELAMIRDARREDLPGRPLVYEAALRSLLAELLGAGRGAAADRCTPPASGEAGG